LGEELGNGIYIYIYMFCCGGQIISYSGCSTKCSVILVVFCIVGLGVLQNLT
jgi:hypothetical protein